MRVNNSRVEIVIRGRPGPHRVIFHLSGAGPKQALSLLYFLKQIIATIIPAEPPCCRAESHGRRSRGTKLL